MAHYDIVIMTSLSSGLVPGFHAGAVGSAGRLSPSIAGATIFTGRACLQPRCPCSNGKVRVSQGGRARDRLLAFGLSLHPGHGLQQRGALAELRSRREEVMTSERMPYLGTNPALLMTTTMSGCQRRGTYNMPRRASGVRYIYRGTV